MKILYLADGVEELGLQKMWFEWAAFQVGAKKYRHQFIAFVNDRKKSSEDIREIVAGSDVILFDYGMLAGLGCGEMWDRWNRFFLQCVEDFPSKHWFCVSSLETFDCEEKSHLKELGVKFYWDMDKRERHRI